MKIIKLHPAASFETTRLYRKSRNKGQSVNIKSFLRKLLIILCLAVVSGITIMAYYSDGVLFENLLTGLFIVGCLLFIKAMNNEKTDIRRIKRNIH